MLRLTIILVLTIIRTSGAVTDGPFKFEKKNGRVTLTEWGKPVFSFQTALKSQAGKYPRANYLHPVYDPDGNIVTEDSSRCLQRRSRTPSEEKKIAIFSHHGAPLKRL